MFDVIMHQLHYFWTQLAILTTSLMGVFSLGHRLVPVEIGDHKRHFDLKHTRNYIVDIHNSFRRIELSHHAANIRRLSWSQALAQEAAVQSTSCIVDYRSRKYGYNYAAAKHPSGVDFDVGHLVKTLMYQWAAEDYDIFQPCDGNCNNFTQMVWAETKDVGCSLHSCASLALPNKQGWLKNTDFFVCMYNVRGNIPGKPPVLFGLRSCSKCGFGELCDNGLCYDKEGCEDSHETGGDCQDWANRGFCVENASWMSKYCSKSCKLCGTSCGDYKSEKYCRLHKAASGCATSPDFSLAYCMKTCGLC